MTTLILEEMRQFGVDRCVAVCIVGMSAGEGEAGVRLDLSERVSLTHSGHGTPFACSCHQLPQPCCQ
jgi:hypothetical protein